MNLKTELDVYDEKHLWRLWGISLSKRGGGVGGGRHGHADLQFIFACF